MSDMKFLKTDFNRIQSIIQIVLKLRVKPNQIPIKFRFNSVEVEVVRIIVRFWFSAFLKKILALFYSHDGHLIVVVFES